MDHVCLPGDDFIASLSSEYIKNIISDLDAGRSGTLTQFSRELTGIIGEQTYPACKGLKKDGLPERVFVRTDDTQPLVAHLVTVTDRTKTKMTSRQEFAPLWKIGHQVNHSGRKEDTAAFYDRSADIDHDRSLVTQPP
ncbi:hypothetical protein GCM10007908_20510 [Rhizobium albus]|nr:hypothetical protein GCM10007908_20510 [Rhizobium albus]